MHKIHCPRCGVINLEGFVTYPQCAGCGSTLPQPHTERIPFWKRPLNVWLWVILFGGALVALLAVVTELRPPRDENEAILFYGVASRRGSVGEIVTLAFNAEVPSQAGLLANKTLREVKLRLPLRVFKSLRFVSISPKPDAMTVSGSSRYFIYKSLPQDTSLTLRLRAALSGRHKVRATLYASDYLPGEWRVIVQISPSSSVIPATRNPLRFRR